MAKYQGDVFNNTKIGSEERDEFFGSWGDDVLVGRGGNDHLSGQENNDELHGDEGNDVLIGGSGDDKAFGGDDDDFITGDDGNDRLEGGAGNDDIDGGRGNDILIGDAGDDAITAISGVDIVSGGSGNDSIYIVGNDGWNFDRVDGGSGNDKIIVEGSKVVAAGGSGNDRFEIDLAKEQVLIGGSGSDRFVVTHLNSVNGALAAFYGGDATPIYGTNWNPAAQYNLGAEIVTGMTMGSDTSVDTLDLSSLTDMSATWAIPDWGYIHRATINLEDGYLAHEVGYVGNGGPAFDMSDVEYVQVAELHGIENVVGSEGADFIVGNGAANDLRGLAGDDIIAARGGNDYIDGSAGDDQLWGEAGDDTILGGADDDLLVGGAGSDVINGGSGNDTIYGDYAGEGVYADTLTGGLGSDTFVFNDVAKTLAAVYNPNPFAGPSVQLTEVSIMDTITDFQTGTARNKAGQLVLTGERDKIDLSDILDARSNFAGVSPGQAISQGYIYFIQHGTEGQPGFGTTVMVDLNGGAHNDAANNYAVVDLAGVRANELSSLHFMI